MIDVGLYQSLILRFIIFEVFGRNVVIFCMVKERQVIILKRCLCHIRVVVVSLYKRRKLILNNFVACTCQISAINKPPHVQRSTHHPTPLFTLIAHINHTFATQVVVCENKHCIMTQR